MLPRKTCCVAAALLLTLLSSGCQLSPAQPSPPVASRVLLSPEAATIEQGEQFQTVVKVVDQYGFLLPAGLATLAPADTSMLSITPSLVVRARGRSGVTEVVVTAGRIRRTMPVTVTQVLSGITFNTLPGTVAQFDTLRLIPVATDFVGTVLNELTFSFETSDSTRATVTKNGLVTVSGRVGQVGVLALTTFRGRVHYADVRFVVELRVANGKSGCCAAPRDAWNRRHGSRGTP